MSSLTVLEGTSVMTIRAHDLMPMFTATGADGTPVRYEDIWQRQNLLLVALPDDDPTSRAYLRSFDTLEPELAVNDAALIVTTTGIEGIPSPGVVVADRWGEVYYVQDANRASGLPTPNELIEWLQYVRNECPECQGETR
jgi:hypothetical protein